MLAYQTWSGQSCRIDLVICLRNQFAQRGATEEDSSGARRNFHAHAKLPYPYRTYILPGTVCINVLDGIFSNKPKNSTYAYVPRHRQD
jgi:hypothetical protein